MNTPGMTDISQWRFTQNPYPERPGYSRRFAYAKRRLEAFGRDCLKPPYSRGFDNCFEMLDGKAVVWALMHHAIHGNVALAMGIRNMGKDVWPRWSAVYNAPKSWAELQPRLPLNDDPW